MSKSESPGGIHTALKLVTEGRRDEAYSLIQGHYRERMAKGREADRSYKLLHILLIASEDRRMIDGGGVAEEDKTIKYETLHSKH